MPVTKATSSSSALQQHAAFICRGITDTSSFSPTTEGLLCLKECLWRISVMWSQCYFKGLPTPAKIINMYIYWGKHWTQMFMALSLAVLQNNIQVKLTICRLKEHMKFHS